MATAREIIRRNHLGRKWLWCGVGAMGVLVLAGTLWVLHLNMPQTGVVETYYGEKRVFGLLVWHGGLYWRTECVTRNGEIVLGQDGNVIQDGKSEGWYESGARYTLSYAKGGIPVGEHMEWREDGTVSSLKRYDSNGQPLDWHRWDENGILRCRVIGATNQMGGEWYYYYSGGELEAAMRYDNLLLEGPYEEYYPNGQLKAKGSFSHGTKVGTWEYWSRNGEPAENAELTYWP